MKAVFKGIIGLVAIYSVFLYPIFIIGFNVKHYKKNLVFNAGMLGIATVFIQSLFNGGIFILFRNNGTLIIVEYYRVKEKYIGRRRTNQNNIEQKYKIIIVTIVALFGLRVCLSNEKKRKKIR